MFDFTTSRLQLISLRCLRLNKRKEKVDDRVDDQCHNIVLVIEEVSFDYIYYFFSMIYVDYDNYHIPPNKVLEAILQIICKILVKIQMACSPMRVYIGGFLSRRKKRIFSNFQSKETKI